jgi:hypothetical protein
MGSRRLNYRRNFAAAISCLQGKKLPAALVFY